MKAILVIDMPKSCAECPIFQEGTDGYCPVGYLVPSNKYEIAKGCPLKPTPLKRETHIYWKSVGIGDIPTHEITDYDKGWNDCVDFMESEE